MPKQRDNHLRQAVLQTLWVFYDPIITETAEKFVKILRDSDHAELPKQLRDGGVRPLIPPCTGIWEDCVPFLVRRAVNRMTGTTDWDAVDAAWKSLLSDGRIERLTPEEVAEYFDDGETQSEGAYRLNPKWIRIAAKETLRSLQQGLVPVRGRKVVSGAVVAGFQLQLADLLFNSWLVSCVAVNDHNGEGIVLEALGDPGGRRFDQASYELIHGGRIWKGVIHAAPAVNVEQLGSNPDVTETVLLGLSQIAGVELEQPGEPDVHGADAKASGCEPQKRSGKKQQSNTQREALQVATAESVKDYLDDECKGYWGGTKKEFIAKFNEHSKSLYNSAKLTKPNAKPFSLTRTTFYRMRIIDNELARAFKPTGKLPQTLLRKGETKPLEFYTTPDDDVS